MLRNANIRDIKKLAKIHFTELNSDFLPSLGERFLELLYLSLIQSKNTYMCVYQLNGDIHGYVVGSKNFSDVFKKVILNNFIKYTLLIFPQLIKKPVIIKKIIETFFYTKKEGNETPSAELVVISITKKYHRRGIGKKLVKALEKKFVHQGIKKYKVTVNAKNLAANSFYTHLGFEKSHNFSLYGKKINLYIKQIL